jgi:TolB protein
MKKNLIKFNIALSVACSIISCDANKRSQNEAKSIPESELAIVYNVLIENENNNYEIFSMNMDGSEKQNITNLPGVEWTYISFQNKVLFISDKDTSYRFYRLYETNYKGDNPRKISDLRLADSWMSTRKNGKEIIVRPIQKIDSAFYIIDLEGNILSRIATGLPYSSDPLFVNDGNQIVFRGGLTKSKLVDGFNEEIYIIDIDGKNIKQLTHYPKNDTTASRYDYHAGMPKLNPTENFISFQSMQNGKYSLFAVSLDGQKQWKLTENNENEGWHDWSPDGKWLVIETFNDSQTQFHISLMNWDTKEMKILTDTSFRFQQCPNFVMKKSYSIN